MDPLDDALNRSATPLPEPPPLGAEVAALVASAMRDEVVRRRRLRRGASLAAVTVLFAGGGVAAATGIWTTPWAAAPDAAITYTLPSGTVCEERLGDLHTSDPAAADPLREWLTSAPLLELADVPASIAESRAHAPQTYTADGSGALPAGTYRTGWSTEYYDEDFEYVAAIRDALGRAIQEKIGSLPGLSSTSWEWSGEQHCSGPNPEPMRPWYMR